MARSVAGLTQITASATSARGCSDASSTNSSGLCALPPRGPSPSTVIGIVAAKWLASDAPPRAAAATRRPSALARALEQRRRGHLGVHARPAADQLRLQVRAADLGRDVLEHGLDRVQLVRAQVAEQLARAGDDVERVAGAQHGRHGGQPRRAGRVVAGGDGLGGGGEREQRVAAAVGRRAGVRAAAVARRRGSSPPPCAARRRPRRRPSSRRPRSTGRRRSPRSARRGRSPPSATPRRRRAAARARRSSSGRLANARSAPIDRITPPFMSTVPEPTSCSPARVSGLCWACATTVSMWPTSSTRRAAGAVQARHEVLGVVGRGARHALDGRLVRAAARRTPTRTRSRRGRRRRATRRRRAPPARAAHGARSPPPPAGSTGPCPPQANVNGRARAARDGDRRPPAGGGAAGRADRVGDDAGAQRAQDVRPAAERARRRDVPRRPPARQAPAARGRDRLARPADAAHAPDVGGPDDALREARVDEGPDLARADPVARRPRAARARVRHQAGGVDQAADAGRAGGRAVAEDARAGGVAGPAGARASCSPRRARCTRCCATSR